MKKVIVTAVAVVMSLSAFAQKIKIDKGAVTLDGKTVAYAEGKKPVFKYTTLDRSYTIIAEFKKIADPAAIPWIELRNESTAKFNEIAFTVGKFNPFNNEKSLIAALIEHDLLSVDGLNQSNIENFINGEPSGVSAMLLGNKAAADELKSLVDAYQIRIDDNGVIYSVKAQNQDPNDKGIGYVKMTSPATNGELMYEIMDLDNYVIARWFAKAAMVSGYNKFLNQELITYDNKVFKAEFDNRGNPTGYKMSKDITPMNIVKVLIGNGYVLGHQYINKK